MSDRGDPTSKDVISWLALLISIVALVFSAYQHFSTRYDFVSEKYFDARLNACFETLKTVDAFVERADTRIYVLRDKGMEAGVVRDGVLDSLYREVVETYAGAKALIELNRVYFSEASYERFLALKDELFNLYLVAIADVAPPQSTAYSDYLLDDRDAVLGICTDRTELLVEG